MAYSTPRVATRSCVVISSHLNYLKGFIKLEFNLQNNNISYTVF